MFLDRLRHLCVEHIQRRLPPRTLVIIQRHSIEHRGWQMAWCKASMSCWRWQGASPWACWRGTHADPLQLAALAVYGSGLLAMVGASALYAWGRGGRRHMLYRHLDHAAIFVMIAGTYTPFVVISFGGMHGRRLLALIWAAALVGVLLRLSAPRRFELLSVPLYLVMGWAVLSQPGLLLSLPASVTILLVARRRVLQRWHRVPLGAGALPGGDLAQFRPRCRCLPLRRDCAHRGLKITLSVARRQWAIGKPAAGIPCSRLTLFQPSDSASAKGLGEALEEETRLSIPITGAFSCLREFKLDVQQHWSGHGR
jgi:hypothetical protein